jgi:hypothetical protein
MEPKLSTNLFVGHVITTPFRFGDTSRVSLNENSRGAVGEMLLASSGANVGGGDAGLHERSSGLVVQSTWHNISCGFLIHNGSGTVVEVLLSSSGAGVIVVRGSYSL